MKSALAFVLALAAWLMQAPALAALPALDLQVDLDPGSQRFHAVALLKPASRDFRFELHESLKIDAVTAAGKTVRILPAGQAGPVRAWRVSVPAGAELRLEYGGTLPALDPGLDHRDVLQGLPPMASESGSFLPAGSAWYPPPGPLFTYRVSLSLPAGQRALVPGHLESESVPADDSGRYRASFRFDHPAEGIDLMAGPWRVREKMVARAEGGPLRLRTYFFPDLDAIPGLADAYLADSQRYIERYSKEIGAYPFAEFSVVASPLPTGFGMPTLTYLGAEVLKLPFIRATSLGHEVLHNWWGNGVYVDYDRGNWSEGLTTFMADYAYKEGESAAAARAMRLAWLRDFAAVPAGDQQTLVGFRSRTHGAEAAVGYGKSAMLFVMLRDLIGEAAFRRALQTFWAERRFTAADWDDLRSAFEKASNRPLAAFFEQWLERAGGPAVTLAAAESRPDHGRYRLSLEVDQAAPAYALHLPVEIVYPDHSEMRWIDTARSRDRLQLATDARPTGLRLDPDLRVWRRLEREQLPPILRQWIIARSPRLALASAAIAGEAEALAARLFEAAPQAVALPASEQGTEPVLLVGLHADVDAALARAGLPARPASLAGRGTAQVWTVERAAGPPLAVISVQDAEALLALQRPLPHYGGQSWLVFDGSRAIDKGIWPAPGRVIPVRAD